MAIRYCGGVKLRISIIHDGGLITPATYKVKFAINGLHVRSLEVTGTRSPRKFGSGYTTLCIDDPEVYDGIASAALSFAADDDAHHPTRSIQDAAHHNISGDWDVRRTPEVFNAGR